MICAAKQMLGIFYEKIRQRNTNCASLFPGLKFIFIFRILW